MRSRKKWLCVDCGVDTGKIHEHYFLRTEIWLKAFDSIYGMLCVGCCEKRLGRHLQPADFTSASINSPKYEAKSQRLMQRLSN